MANKENKGGRPPRYGDEKPIRIGAYLRPRYKEMLEIISKQRNTSMNEALEFMIAATSRCYAMENKSVFEWVVPSEPMVLQIYAVTIDGKSLSKDEKQEREEQVQHLLEKQNKPFSLLNNLDKFNLEILTAIEYELLILGYEEYRVNDNLAIKELLVRYFDTGKLFDVIADLWRSAERADAIALAISVIITTMHPKFKITQLKNIAIEQNCNDELSISDGFKQPLSADIAINNQNDFDNSASLLNFAYTLAARERGLNNLKYMLGKENVK